MGAQIITPTNKYQQVRKIILTSRETAFMIGSIPIAGGDYSLSRTKPNRWRADYFGGVPAEDLR